MSSNIRVQKVCLNCNIEFTAKTTVTKYCSNKCGKSAWKKRKQAEKVQKVNKATRRKITAPKIEVNIKDKEFLTVKEVAILLNCTNRTVYHLIDTKKLKAVNLGKRITRVKRIHLNKLFTN
ncbi:helix-turn-helix domain-containing protein [Tenacibaculum finnmarkense]|uniref:helix-turn-helix domain-containing protein n=1 Tax=Tenacibaculum finnmarkense TaxID=2781243 RepID=UPI001E421C95|nr:helix-turn-helix domain-containing protein [Tenacibaculum finnmarkense]MCD8417818.1 helix-turn-helix domain-containing protein [Tenacibaculum finnmarkense genomovar finnmarkense]MCG8186206.1 helix-turn-helix domain-containing protein [Tenacibaculum finnmarkense genomovar finnmarkense]MCG8203452.1 helix-turn-helix domain-containing protein [Tenacibaculum finnmarkense genomovar finnmarkense]MCG8210935.1 helix-turn-helix domain-containing protein [Tenacibaculum finnmarkense genomovar finnmarken